MAKKNEIPDPFGTENDEPEKRISRVQIARATKKKSLVAGQYIRRTFTYLPEQLEDIVTISKETNMSENDVVRWFVDHMVEAYRQGLRPEIEASSVKVQPKLRGR